MLMSQERWPGTVSNAEASSSGRELATVPIPAIADSIPSIYEDILCQNLKRAPPPPPPPPSWHPLQPPYERASGCCKKLSPMSCSKHVQRHLASNLPVWCSDAGAAAAGPGLLQVPVPAGEGHLRAALPAAVVDAANGAVAQPVWRQLCGQPPRLSGADERHTPPGQA